MPRPSTIHHTFVIERSFPVPPKRVFAAFADPAIKQRWFIGAGNHAPQHYELDFRIGGKECAEVRLPEGTPVAGLLCSNHTTYLNVVPDRRIVFSSTMAIEANCISASLGTVELLAVETGTEMIFTCQSAFFEGADGPKMREGGWISLFARLAAELAR